MWAATGLRSADDDRVTEPLAARDRRGRAEAVGVAAALPPGLGVYLLVAGEHGRQRAGIPLWHGLADRDGHGGHADRRRPGLKPADESSWRPELRPFSAQPCAPASAPSSRRPSGWGSAAGARGSAPPPPAAPQAAAPGRGCRARRRRSGPGSPPRSGFDRTLEQRDRLVVAALVRSARSPRSFSDRRIGRGAGSRASAGAAGVPPRRLAPGPARSAAGSAAGGSACLRRPARRRRRSARGSRPPTSASAAIAAATGQPGGGARRRGPPAGPAASGALRSSARPRSSASASSPADAGRSAGSAPCRACSASAAPAGASGRPRAGRAAAR